MAENNYGLPDDLSVQALYDKVAVHLMTQGEPSYRGRDANDLTCAYRGQGGVACAVGCLISDEDYAPVIESINVDALLDDVMLSEKERTLHSRRPALFPKQYAEAQYRKVMGDLQHLHDNAPLKGDGTFDRRKLRSHLRVIADHHGLNYEVLWRKEFDS